MHTFSFSFFLQFVTFLFCFVLFCCSLNFQADTSLFLFHLIVENLILHIFLIIMIIIPCSGMFRNVPGCSGIFHVPEYSMFQVLSTPLNRCKYTNFASFFAKLCFYPWITVLFILFILVFTCCWRHH